MIMAAKVRIPTPLRKLTNNEELVEVRAGTIGAAIAELQSRYPGIQERLLDETGAVQDPHVIESAGEVLDRAVLESVRRWRYEPARKNGVKVKTRIQVKTTFQAP